MYCSLTRIRFFFSFSISPNAFERAPIAKHSVEFVKSHHVYFPEKLTLITLFQLRYLCYSSGNQKKKKGISNVSLNQRNIST